MVENNSVNPIVSTIDFAKDGKHHGFLKLPYSRDDSAWGAIMIPICQVKNGEGQTALITGANHGDEYEGPVALMNMCNELKPEEVEGRVIIIPMMNYPAFRNATRTSPIDKGNLNRAFPGSPKGTVTQKIADYFQNILLPMCDYVLDFHSGGKTLDFIPFAAAHILPDKMQQQQCVDAMNAFGAPYSMMMLEIDDVGMYDTAVENAGKIFVTTELGGGGSSTAKGNRIAINGCHNFLVHSGIKKGELIEVPSSVLLDMPDSDCFIASESEGLFEACVDLGEAIEHGQIIAKVHDTTRTGVEPYTYRAKRNGILVTRHFPGLIKTGDCVAVIADVVG